MKKIPENTVEGQLRKIEPKWLRDLALKRMEKDYATKFADDIPTALGEFCFWRDTPKREGEPFWNMVWKHYRQPNVYQLPADPYAKKKPAKPKKGERYYVVTEGMRINGYVWDDITSNTEHRRVGNCFRTRELARQAQREIKRVLKEANHE
jgi:hypothetical protein